MDECESEESSGKEMWQLLLKGNAERLENYINSHMKDVAKMLLYEDSTNGHETNTCIELFVKKSGKASRYHHFTFIGSTLDLTIGLPPSV